ELTPGLFGPVCGISDYANMYTPRNTGKLYKLPGTIELLQTCSKASLERLRSGEVEQNNSGSETDTLFRPPAKSASGTKNGKF
ncbi:hypothetical protein ACJMK2_012831, partial [Sinanodonta woodiana]